MDMCLCFYICYALYKMEHMMCLWCRDQQAGLQPFGQKEDPNPCRARDAFTMHRGVLVVED